jgi:hypothetical protein
LIFDIVPVVLLVLLALREILSGSESENTRAVADYLLASVVPMMTLFVMMAVRAVIEMAH